jgi:glycosyltransferase involved in cell wall biosynthesis
LQRIPDTPPKVAALPANTIRPFWSVMIPAYNCSVFLPDAIQSVLEQDPGEEFMQIEVVDDCSTDADIETLVKRIGKGRVSYFRQEKNVGSLRNFETCINRAKGEYIHLLHGDDRVKAEYYRHIQALFTKYPEAGAAFCAWNYIDERGLFLRPFTIQDKKVCIVEDCLLKLANQQFIQYVSVAVKREVYEKLGTFYGVTYGEDWEMWARIAKNYPIAYTPKMLAEYREHDNSISYNSYLSGQNIRDFKKAFTVINSYLPKEKQKLSGRISRKTYTYWALDKTMVLWNTTNNKQIVYSQLKEIVKLYADVKVLKMMLKIVFRIQLEVCIKKFK